MRNEKICVYTCITGDYDNLKEIKKEEGIDYYCFTNNKKITSNSWNVIYIENEEDLSNVKLARKIKILGHPLINHQYDILLWMDGAVVFKKKIKDFIAYYMKDEDEFVAFQHGERNSIKEEAESCIRFKKETKENIEKLLKFYQKEKYKDKNGLIESTVFMKRTNSKKVMETMSLWFSMIKNYSKRDQLSFNYCIDKTGLKVKWIKEKVFDNDWFDWISHNHSNEIKKYRIYFGEEEDYQSIYDIQGEYNVKNDCYHLKVKIPKTTNHTIIEITDVPCVFFDNIKINQLKEKDYIVYNYVSFHDKKIFYNKNAVLLITKKLEKGNWLDFQITLNVLTEQEKNELIEYLSVKRIKSNFLKSDYEILKQEFKTTKEELENMKNSKSWKITKPLRYLTNILKRNKI